MDDRRCISTRQNKQKTLCRFNVNVLRPFSNRYVPHSRSYLLFLYPSPLSLVPVTHAPDTSARFTVNRQDPAHKSLAVTVSGHVSQLRKLRTVRPSKSSRGR